MTVIGPPTPFAAVAAAVEFDIITEAEAWPVLLGVMSSWERWQAGDPDVPVGAERARGWCIRHARILRRDTEREIPPAGNSV